MGTEEVRALIKDADMVLVGLGEDFDDVLRLRSCPEYARGKEALQEAGEDWLLPAWKEYCSAKMEDIISPVLAKLSHILEDKDYFVVATATDSRIAAIPWRKDRLVMPCGTMAKKQCTGGCGCPLEDVSGEDRARLLACFDKLYGGCLPIGKSVELARCPKCGAAMALNNIFADNYDEQGYKERWHLYTRWLQGTLNRRLVALELGVGMQFPSVIRWPFEKTVYFNRKAVLIRVHEKLYQMTEELSGKGWGISQNAIAWLVRL